MSLRSKPFIVHKKPSQKLRGFFQYTDTDSFWNLFSVSFISVLYPTYTK